LVLVFFLQKMYKGKRQQVVPIEEHHGSDDDMVNEELVTQETVDEEMENVEAGVVTIPRHVRAENFKNRRTIFLSASFTGTPEEFNQNKQRLEWHMATEMGRLFKHNMAAVNRHIAEEQDLRGSLKRGVPLDFEVVAVRNSLPWEAGIHIDGLMPQVVTAHGAALWTIPADVQYTMVNQKVFEPTHFVEEHLMETAQQCSLEDVGEDIQVVRGDKTKGKASYGTVAVGTLAHAGLLEKLEQGMWHSEPLSAEHWEEIYNTPAHRRTLHVTSKMALELKADMEKELRELEARCMNFENLTVRCERQDGFVHPNNPEGLHGQLVGSDIDPTHKLSDAVLNKVCNVYFLGKLTFSTLE
jgi:hypothetical protein